jgi:carbon-monoxide dehydrogenase medium subunit
MKPVAFDYERPVTLADAATLLGQSNGFAKILAGGQSLGAMLNLRLAQPDLLVDITSIPELTAVTDAGDHLEIGPASHMPISKTAAWPTISPDCSARSPAASPTARAQSRHHRRQHRARRPGRGLAFRAGADRCQGRGLVSRGNRPIPVADLVVSSFTTVLQPDELIRSVRVPKLSAGARWGFYKFSQKAGEFAHAIGGVLHDPARNVFRAVIGAIETAPIVVADAAALFGGRLWLRASRTPGSDVGAATPRRQKRHRRVSP